MADPGEFRSRFIEGVEHFNARAFWDAHEAWEELWLEATGEARQFLQGLIQLAAAYHHVQRGTFSGAVRLFAAALQKLAPVEPFYCGVERTSLVRRADEHRCWVAALLDQAGSREIKDRLGEIDYPRIELRAGWQDDVPPPRQR